MAQAKGGYTVIAVSASGRNNQANTTAQSNAKDIARASFRNGESGLGLIPGPLYVTTTDRLRPRE